MNRSFYFDYIADKIDNLCSRINSLGKLNILNLNIHAEFFYRDLCNLIFGLDLINANMDIQNIAAIDLIDKTNKTLIQVSSSCTKKKVNETLSKDDLLDYKKQGYTLKFLFFSDAKNLRKNSFTNKHGIQFNPKTDILDKDSILKFIIDCSVVKQKEIYELVKSELGERPDPLKITTNLAELINLLAEEDLGVNLGNSNLHEYNIDCKIKFNELTKIKGVINQYKIYYTKLNGIYEEFDKQGRNKSLSVYNKLTGFYNEEILNDETKQIQKFFNIVNKTVSHIRQSENYNELRDEELELCVLIIIVDAFIKCKIFENPEGYIHVIA
ncbi:ABC-three component system protein [Bacillus infantis]|uniref:ABC-three component system protein n=1 Tax=Bacillus infantis TaxID=324767 RepID=UPI0020A04118|nr:ABC-three component system protein [Bacillus infantis]MCP1156999.1 SMEK domain-containing protein [Bacillus infantis]